MNFTDAMKIIDEGGKVRLAHWALDYFLDKEKISRFPLALKNIREGFEKFSDRWEV